MQISLAIRNVEVSAIESAKCIGVIRRYVRSVPRKLRAMEGFSHKGESVKRGSTVYKRKSNKENHFSEMKGIVGMSHNEKKGNKKMPIH